jgi:hypothetical protein
MNLQDTVTEKKINMAAARNVPTSRDAESFSTFKCFIFSAMSVTYGVT